MIRPFQTRPASAARHGQLPRCGPCGAYATTEAFFELHNCVVVKKYCDKCLADAAYEIST